ncbi:Alkyl hydroperoxide reductase AhpD [Planctomycetes bacterium Pla163]|uniref:Alkyl hydroperoxide reductase AhpD n=1 Tax=Rohdeia mirabilis TaxID=2528008 RepID=A0A518CZD0_9BACT|nr:Alkyl hydroperoxide reductase AhpD [Planctomycetes bacterium Pla163]
MNIEDLRARLPETAKDMRLNLSNIVRSEHLTERQLYGCLLATAFAARNRELLAAAEGEAATKLSPEDVALVKSVATTMSMNNVYYRFVHLVGNEQYSQMPARLRMQALGGGSEGKVDRELWSIAVSAVNGCGMCITSHEQVLTQHGATREMIQDAVRIAAVVAATAAALDAEAPLNVG